MLTADPPAQLDAFQTRHHPIQDHHLRSIFLLQDAPGIQPVLQCGNAVIPFPQNKLSRTGRDIGSSSAISTSSGLDVSGPELVGCKRLTVSLLPKPSSPDEDQLNAAPAMRKFSLQRKKKYPPDSCLAGTVCRRAVSTLLSSSASPWPNEPSGRPQSSGAPPARAASASAWYKNVRYSAYPGRKERHQRVLVDRADSFVPLSVARLQTPTPSDLP